MEKKVTSSVTMGIVISLVLIVLAIIAYITGIDQQSWYRWLSILIFAAGIIYVCTNYGKQMDNNVTFGNTFAFGFKTSALVTCLMVVFSIVFVLVFPEMKEKAIDTARKQMEEKQNMTEDQINTAISFVQKSFMLFVVLGSLFFYLVCGVIASLIGAAITKKNPPSPFEQQS